MWHRIKAFFLHSETIFLARAQVFIGLALTSFAEVRPDLFTELTGKYFPVFLVIHGMVIGYVRKRGAKDLKDRGSKLPL